MKELIRSCLHFCNLSYQDEEWIRKGLDNKLDKINDEQKLSLDFLQEKNIIPRINYKKNIELNSILYCIFDNTIYISFPGISTNTDIKKCSNFSFKYYDYFDCQFHRGIYGIFLKLKDELDLIVDMNIEFYNKIIFTGHSLGGAIAKIFAIYIKKLYPEIENNCVTFACPILGDSKFNKLSDDLFPDCITISCQKDFLLRIPLWRNNLNSNKYMIDDKGNLVKYENIDRRYLYNMISRDITTHRLKYYMTHLL